MNLCRHFSRCASLIYLQLHRKGNEGSAILFRKTLYGATFRDVPFVPLQSATFSMQCELLSTSSKPYCLACGSRTMLALSRVLGGSFRHQRITPLISEPNATAWFAISCAVPDPAIIDVGDRSRAIAERAQHLTGATSAVFALRSGG